MMRDKVRLKNARAILHVQDINSEDPSQPTRAQQILNKTKGVLKVEINHLTNILSVEYNPDEITVDEIKRAIAMSPENQSER
jgi:hypothetical protein